MVQSPLLPEDDKLTSVSGKVFLDPLNEILTHANNGNWLQSKSFQRHGRSLRSVAC